jgi:hypothetical protein
MVQVAGIADCRCGSFEDAEVRENSDLVLVSGVDLPRPAKIWRPKKMGACHVLSLHSTICTALATLLPIVYNMVIPCCKFVIIFSILNQFKHTMDRFSYSNYRKGEKLRA